MPRSTPLQQKAYGKLLDDPDMSKGNGPRWKGRVGDPENTRVIYENKKRGPLTAAAKGLSKAPSPGWEWHPTKGKY